MKFRRYSLPPPVPLIPEGLIKAVRFYEQVKRENPPVETGAWKDAVDWVLEEACQAVNISHQRRVIWQL
ncbi:putative prophage protein [Escherichia coli]|nr:putative prophage protein [Escherichia coli]